MAKIEEGPYAAAWREHRRRDRWFWAAFLGYLPGVPLLGTVISGLVGHGLYLPTAIAWMIAISIAGYRSGMLRCPRCGQRYYVRTFFHNGFARRCLHCGLPKWASGSLDRPA